MFEFDQYLGFLAFVIILLDGILGNVILNCDYSLLDWWGVKRNDGRKKRKETPGKGESYKKKDFEKVLFFCPFWKVYKI